MPTINFVPLTGPQDWNDPANWDNDLGPTASDSALLVTPVGTDATWAVISGGASDLIDNVTLRNTGLVVGASDAFGGHLSGTSMEGGRVFYTDGSGTLSASGTISTDTSSAASVPPSPPWAGSSSPPPKAFSAAAARLTARSPTTE